MAPSTRSVKLKKAAKKNLTDLGKRIPLVQRAMRSALKAKRTRSYHQTCAEVEVDDRTVMFECYAGRGYTCSPRALYQRMLADPKFEDYTFVWAFRQPALRELNMRGDYDVRGLTSTKVVNPMGIERAFGADALEELKHAILVPYSSPEYYHWHAKARHWITNYILPTHMLPRDGQVYLQTWHGTPLKRLGCDIAEDKANAMYEVDDIHKRYLEEGERFTHLVSPSPFTTEKLETAFGLPDHRIDDVIIEEGYPRNDYLRTVTPEKIAETKRRLRLPGDKKVILYAPTFRDDQHATGVGYTLKAEADFDLLQRELGDDHIILFRPHYLVANRFNFARFDGFIRDASAIQDINDLYVVSDMLITDYSSVFFDYANLGRPILFFMYDLERYAEELRGFYLDLEELPGPIVRTESELVRAIRDADTYGNPPADRINQFTERFNGLDDGDAAQRVLDRLF